ncbi:MAG TPA: hypothetical protein VJR29_05130 [bacterium]|nr:hypothetical protein [bacterium]
MKRMTILLTLLGFLAAAPLQAGIYPEGAGIVYGQNFAFNIKAPKGWVLDTESGVEQGAHAVFYPVGQTWSDSVIVAYARSRPITEKIKTPNDAAQDTVAQFKKNGSPNHQAKLYKTLKTESGQEVQIFQFTGDQYGNSEAAAYYMQPDKGRINFIVLSSRDAKAYQASLPAFEELAKSYKPMDASIKDKR